MRRTALVTGATGGVGAAVARELAAAGWVVLAHGHRGTAPGNIPGAQWLSADLATGSGVSELVAHTQAQTAQLDLLVHCAGRLPQTASSEWADAAELFHLHAFALYRLATELRVQLGVTGGTIVVVSSSSAVRFAPGQHIYGATKAAAESLVHHLGYLLGPEGIRVVGIRPTLLRTRMSSALLADAEFTQRLERQSPFGRLGTPEDIAGLVLALGSGGAAWMTGQTVWADGGVTLGWCDDISA